MPTSSGHHTARLPHPKKARAAAGLSQRALAKAAGTHQAVVCRFEKSGQYPTNYLLRQRYLAALGLTEPAAAKGGAK